MVLVVATTGLVALALVRELTGARAPSGLDYAGPLTRELLPVARLVGELAAVAVVAGLMASLLTARRRGGRSPGGLGGARLAPSVTAWALAWSVVAGGSALLAASEVSNQTVGQVLGTGLLLDYLVIIPQARYQVLSALVVLGLALATAVLGRRGEGAGVVPVLLLLAAAGLAAGMPLVTGHAASAANHYLAITTLVVHVLAALVWVGGLAGLVVHLRGDDDLALAAGRFDTVALACFVVVALSGVLNAGIRVDDPGLLVTTTYGGLLLAKAAALVVLGGFGAWHRRATLRRVRAGSATAFRRVAAAEVVVMAATVGLAVALARTPTP